MLAALLLSVPVLIPALPAADRWAPFQDRTYSSDHGAYAVTIRRRGQGARFTLLQRTPGTAPLESADVKAGLPRGQRPPATAEATVLAEGSLAHLPFEVLVSDSGHGFAAIETYARMGHGHSMTTVNAKGETAHALPLEALFTPEEIEQLNHSVSSIWWHKDMWIDEGSGELIVTSDGSGMFPKSRRLRVFAWGVGHPADGRVRPGVCPRGPPTGRGRGAQAALDRFSGEARADLTSRYIELLHRKRVPATRLRAAVALAELDDLRGADLVRYVAFDPRAGTLFSIPNRTYALSASPSLLGEEAIPLLIETLRARPDLLRSDKSQALRSFGARALPHLEAAQADPLARPSHQMLMAEIEASIRSASREDPTPSSPDK